MLTETLKETPLADIHRESGARMVDFAGWNMPVQYRSIVKEHMTVRQTVGLFDVSHMGEFSVSGAGSKDFLQYLIANDLDRLQTPNSALYTQFINENGGTVDDLIIYRREKDYWLVVNASNIEKDWLWLNKHHQQFQAAGKRDIELKDCSAQTALLALQGPKSLALMQKLIGQRADISTFHYACDTADGIDISFGRTGYTGEDGFEIFVDSSKAVDLWKLIIDAGKEYGIEPCGLGARDTLRLEAALPLYGHELDDQTSPLEAGLGFSVSLKKNKFIGQEKLRAQKEHGLKKQLICLQCEGKALPRQGYKIKVENNSQADTIGIITSGSQGIYVGYPIAMAYVPPQYASIGNKLYVEIRDTYVLAKIVSRPFYRRGDARASERSEGSKQGK